MIVVDSNVIGYFFLSGERSSQMEQVYKKDPEWCAPLLWRSELRNVLALYMRREILSFAEAQQIMNEAMGLMAGQEFEVSSNEVLKLASRSSCSAYDCEFVALAREIKVPLVTVDRQLLTQFPDIARSPADYLNA
ncbi:MAG: PIN domain-containing protein [Desulfobacteraceae bacterium]|nr:MAG: PIN domain-containing protein [Desulfobacteraceae bacterium]